jgi:hypothetical protein
MSGEVVALCRQGAFDDIDAGFGELFGRGHRARGARR